MDLDLDVLTSVGSPNDGMSFVDTPGTAHFALAEVEDPDGVALRVERSQLDFEWGTGNLDGGILILESDQHRVVGETVTSDVNTALEILDSPGGFVRLASISTLDAPGLDVTFSPDQVVELDDLFVSVTGRDAVLFTSNSAARMALHDASGSSYSYADGGRALVFGHVALDPFHISSVRAIASGTEGVFLSDTGPGPVFIGTEGTCFSDGACSSVIEASGTAVHLTDAGGVTLAGIGLSSQDRCTNLTRVSSLSIFDSTLTCGSSRAAVQIAHPIDALALRDVRIDCDRVGVIVDDARGSVTLQNVSMQADGVAVTSRTPGVMMSVDGLDLECDTFGGLGVFGAVSTGTSGSSRLDAVVTNSTVTGCGGVGMTSAGAGSSGTMTVEGVTIGDPNGDFPGALWFRVQQGGVLGAGVREVGVAQASTGVFLEGTTPGMLDVVVADTALDVTEKAIVAGASAATVRADLSAVVTTAPVALDAIAGGGALHVTATGFDAPSSAFVAESDLGTLCLDASLNTVASIQVGRTAGGFVLPGYPGAGTDGVAVEAYLAGQNAAASVQASPGGAPGFIVG
ncbi:MAG: hypothetical protein KDB69_00360, partial [Acidimicrobiia bacterium]|nr:hypothetical protein [Acidimicrobiia bacterium]